MKNYQVVYESDLEGLESQIVSDPLTFQDAHDLAIALNADAFSERNETNYTVQPVT